MATAIYRKSSEEYLRQADAFGLVLRRCFSYFNSQLRYPS